MPNQVDWISLKKTINSYESDVIRTWGQISENNAEVLCADKCYGKTLFHYLLANEHFYDANTIASCAVHFNEETIELIYGKHHDKYIEILKILCTDKMILLYEQYYDKIYGDTIDDDDLYTNQRSNFNEIYRTIISKRFEKMILEKKNDNLVLELINEFKFLSHSCLENFYNFCLGITKIEQVIRFTELYRSYTEFIPLIYRLINEYYLEYIKYHIDTIDDIFGNSHIIVSEYYDNLDKIIMNLPKKYVDFRYTDRYGNNIIFCLIKLPILSEQINNEIYRNFFVQLDHYPFEIKDKDNNTIFHVIALHENDFFLSALMDWFYRQTNKSALLTTANNSDDPDDPSLQCKNDYQNNLSKVLQTENLYGKTVFDILFEKNNYSILISLIKYMPPKAYLKLTNKLINNFEIIDKIPNSEGMDKIYLDSINYFINELFRMKQNITFDLVEYSDYKTKIIKLLSRCSNKLNFSLEYQLEWLAISIKNNDFDIYKGILLKYFPVDQNSDLVKYLGKVLTDTGEPIIITAIKEQKISYVKCLLKYNIDLQVSDKLNRNALIAALETKNIFIIRLIHNHIIKIPLYENMVIIMENYIKLLEANETYNNFSFADMIKKIFNTIEYFINYIVNTFGENNELESDIINTE
jgi:hypothetical protein